MRLLTMACALVVLALIVSQREGSIASAAVIPAKQAMPIAAVTRMQGTRSSTFATSPTTVTITAA